MKQIGFLGFGYMGESIASALRDERSDLKIGIVEKQESRIALAKEKFSAIDYSSSLDQFFTQSDLVVLAIKPQDLKSTAEEIKKYTANANIISILAGKNLNSLTALLGTKNLVRFMPNLAADVKKSITSVSFAADADDDFRTMAWDVASSFGLALELEEEKIHSIIGVSGSAIAFVYEFIHALAMSGVQWGFKYDQAKEIALTLLEGASLSLRKSGLNPIEMVSKVTSPSGTTIAGVKALEDLGFRSTVMNAVEATVLRSKELEKN